MNRKSLVGALGLAAVTTGIAVFETVVGRRLSRKVARAVTRTARYQSGRLAGLRYRISGRHPDPTVEDSILADRVRSMLGPLEHRLDIPRIHVLVEGHKVLLHGDVTSEAQAEAIISAARDVPGVQAVTSHIHIGLFPGDTRPSEGSGHPAMSAALASVLAAAHGGGASEGSERACARSVLSTFAALLPEGERRHVLTHLPTDLRILAEPLRPSWAGHAHPRRLDKFALAALPNVEPDARQAIVESVIGALRELVPEEIVDVAAVLPENLRPLWKSRIPR
jgi:uncharacterized protein (DUF2267 family)